MFSPFPHLSTLHPVKYFPGLAFAVFAELQPGKLILKPLTLLS